MAGFWFFIPDCTESSLLSNGRLSFPPVRDRGLDGVFQDLALIPDHAILQSIRSGPDGLAGSLIYPVPASGNIPKNPGMDLEAQTYRKANGGKYWIGWLTDEPPVPMDLERLTTVQGLVIQDDSSHNWTIPIGRAEWNPLGTLPAVYAFDDDDKPMVSVATQHRAFWKDSQRLWDLLRSVSSVEGDMFIQALTAEHDDFCFDMVRRALAINYRVNNSVLATISQIRPDWLSRATARVMLNAICDNEAYRDFLEAQKKTVTPSAADGLSSTIGTQVETEATAPV